MSALVYDRFFNSNVPIHKHYKAILKANTISNTGNITKLLMF